MEKLRHLNAKLPLQLTAGREREEKLKGSGVRALAAECHQHAILKQWEKRRRFFCLSLAAPFASPGVLLFPYLARPFVLDH